MASSATGSRPEAVVLDALVCLKVLKHARENPLEPVHGPLLGLVIGKTLEITNSFPFPRTGDSSGDDDDEQYQVAMMRCLRGVNIDHHQVGWYQSSPLGTSLTDQILLAQYDHQSQIEESVVLVYDPVRTGEGALSLRAYRLTTAAMKLLKGQEFSARKLKEAQLHFDSIFDELPVEIRTSPLACVLVDELTKQTPEEEHFKGLDLASHSFLEHNVHALMNCIDELQSEAQKYYYYQRQLQRQQQQQQNYLQKKKMENVEREEQGQPPLPEENLKNNPLFKDIPLPSRLESLLISGQIHDYCGQISKFASQSYAKLFLAESLLREAPANAS